LTKRVEREIAGIKTEKVPSAGSPMFALTARRNLRVRDDHWNPACPRGSEHL